MPSAPLARKHRRLPIALAIAAAAAWSTSKADTPPAKAARADPAVVEFLLASSAKDFKGSGTVPSALRHVRTGMLTDAGRDIPLLCGAFKTGTGRQAQWTDFATIKTSDYEQWLGGTAKSFCDQRTIAWHPGDLSSELLARLKR